MGNAEAWDRAALRYQEVFDPPPETVHYGPGLPTDVALRLLPGLLGRRVLELGCGGGQAAVAFARQGAHTIALDCSPEQLTLARRLAERSGAAIEFHSGDLAELAFIPAESIDLVFSAATLDYVEDLGRALRSVHRVLRPKGALVFTLEHPLALCLEAAGSGLPMVARSYADPTPLKVDRYGEAFLVYPRTLSGVLGLLTRAGFRVEAMAEPAPEGALVPPASIWRARKDT